MNIKRTPEVVQKERLKSGKLPFQKSFLFLSELTENCTLSTTSAVLRKGIIR